MKKLKTTPKIIAHITIVFGALWLGSYATRLIISYNMFIENDFVLKEFITQDNLKYILLSISPVITLSAVLYLVFIGSFTVFLTTSKISMKKNGWLFIVSAIIYLTLPFELFLTIKIDYNLIMFSFSGIQDANLFLSLIIDRFKIFGSFPLILICSYITIPYFLIFTPFTMSEQNNEG